MSNGTIGGSNHGYGPIGGGISNIMNNNMNINVYKQNSSGNNNTKDSIPFSKINSKMKKKQFNNNLNGLQ
jgi:hypothetical protein